MKFGTVIPRKVTKKFVGKRFQNCSYSDDDVTNYVNFLKNYAKNWLKYVFFVKLQKNDFQDLFSAFETQYNIQIEYIFPNMLMFLKNPKKNAKLSKNEPFFSKGAKSWFLIFWLLIFIQRKKGNCKLLLYECNHIIMKN